MSDGMGRPSSRDDIVPRRDTTVTRLPDRQQCRESPAEGRASLFVDSHGGPLFFADPLDITICDEKFFFRRIATQVAQEVPKASWQDVNGSHMRSLLSASVCVSS